MKKTSLLKNKLLVIGCGRLGSAIASDRSRKGESVITIDSDESALLRLDEAFTGISLVGDATDLSKLEEAQIKTAREVIITTGDDNVNLFLAHVCRVVYDVPSIIVRFDDPSRGEFIKDMDIKPIYPLELSVNAIEGGN